MSDERSVANELDDLRSEVGRLHTAERQRQHADLESRLESSRIGLSPGPGEPITGQGPYEPAVVLARRIVGRKEMSLAPADMDIDITYLSPGVPSTVARTDDLALAISTVINWIVPGVTVGSVVITHDDGNVVTVTPTYTGTDITHIDRVVT